MDILNLLRDFFKDFFARFISNVGITELLAAIAMIIIWVIIGLIVTKILKLIILGSKKFDQKHSKQSKTLRRLVNNLLGALLVFWIVIMILKEIGIDITAVLAGAGVVAFAIGFGAQELIKDLIGGFFLIIENTFSIGDTVNINDYTGEVKDIGLRRTKIVTWKGEVVTINNGDIKIVVNYSLNPTVALLEFQVEHATDIRVFESDDFKKFLEDFAETQEAAIGKPTDVIVTSLSGGHISLRTSIPTRPWEQFGVQRNLRKALVNYCHENDIDLEIPLVVDQLNPGPANKEAK